MRLARAWVERRLRDSDAWRRTPALERWVTHAATLAVGGSGLVLAWMKYLLPPDEEGFSVVNHPWQPDVLHAHVLAAPALVLAAGLLLRSHVIARLADPLWRRSRRSGWVLTITLLPMVASGYLIQVVTEQRWRTAWVVLHVASSLLFLAGAALHVASSRGWLTALARTVRGPTESEATAEAQAEPKAMVRALARTRPT